VTTDIHAAEEASIAAQFVDVIQIPAFLCRQTDILEAAAKTGKFVNIKKGQFMSAEAMSFAVQKVRKEGNNNIFLTDRGTCFGYQDLIVDFRSIPIMQSNNVPVIVDCTHSLQIPNQRVGVTGGKPEFIPTLAKAAIAVGCDGIFIETHPNPKSAKSDGANMLPLSDLENLLGQLVKIRAALK
jgi:2-dehydro-3-deoxyphosphooctonate aldolase (KDO 8-P synthase)